MIFASKNMILLHKLTLRFRHVIAICLERRVYVNKSSERHNRRKSHIYQGFKLFDSD